MRVQTSRFGVIDVDERSIVRMLTGPLGFEDRTDFCLIQHRPDCRFRWLQSTTDPDLAFVVIDPTHHFPDYEVDIDDADAQALRLAGEQDVLVLAIVTIAHEGRHVTANLAAPIVINSASMLGMQIVLRDDRYCTQHNLPTKEQKAPVQNRAA